MLRLKTKITLLKVKIKLLKEFLMVFNALYVKIDQIVKIVLLF